MIDTETALEARDNLTWIAARWPALHSHLAPTTGNTARTTASPTTAATQDSSTHTSPSPTHYSHRSSHE